MLLLIYLYVVLSVGFLFFHLKLQLLETEYITYRYNMEYIIYKINAKFEIFDSEEINNIELMESALEKIKL